MKIRVALMSTLSLIAVSVCFAYTRPSEDGVVLQSFGQNIDGAVARGIKLSGANIRAKSVDSGEIVFSRSESVQDDLLPSKMGSSIVVQYGDSMRGVYTQIDTATVNLSSKDVGVDEVLGLGYLDVASNLRTFQFFLFDNKLKQYVNPTLFLNDLVAAGLGIGPLIVVDAAGRETILQDGASLSGGSVNLVLAPYAVGALAPYAVDLEYMGDLVSRVRMDNIASHAGVAVLSGADEHPISSLYDAKGRLRLGSVFLAAGRASLTVRVSGIDGQTRMSRSFSIPVTDPNIRAAS